MKLRFAGTTVGLALGLTAAVVLACGVAAYFYSTHHFKSLLEMARTNALAEGELIRSGLEHQMLENDRTLLAQMIERFGKQARVEQLVLLDRNGVPRYSSAPLKNAEEFRLGSPTCQACHQVAPEHRGSSRVIETAGGSILRTVIPIRNHQECHGCHEASQRINGILILDYNAGEVRAAMTRDLRWMVAGTGLLTFFIVGSIALVIRFSVLKRLQRIETTARLVSQGDLDRRVPVEGSDILSWIGREFNTMADAVSGLVTEVRTERERLETVINSIDDGIVVLDPDRKIIAANDAFLARTRGSREQLLGCGCYDMQGGPCKVSSCPTVDCLRSGARQVRICERRRDNNTVAWEEIHASPILDSSGKLAQVVEVWRDISERRAAEANLAESHRLASLGVLASGFSHELNTPLATVLTCVEGILRDTPSGQTSKIDSARISRNAGIAREQILRCRGITQHFLRLSRGQRHELVVVDLQQAIAAAQLLVDPTARAHSVQIEVSPFTSSLHVRAADAELQNMLINLMLNAIQASKPGSKVVVAALGGPDVRIRVTDQGCGIAPECQKKIFEPFFSLREGGTGLGLFLSLSAARSWGGDILVQSTPGQGSSFEVVLPAIHSAPEKEPV
ncbi:MAG TPA: ATP-binding protein [Candidatus Angelobacter sp.]|jgi:two-component system, NtrC family, sensor kinase|nr:ATP-binding protein [Candidatus Angelobacter sp.]